VFFLVSHKEEALETQTCFRAVARSACFLSLEFKPAKKKKSLSEEEEERINP